MIALLKLREALFIYYRFSKYSDFKVVAKYVFIIAKSCQAATRIIFFADLYLGQT